MLQQWRKSLTIALTPDSITINSGKKVLRTLAIESASAEKSSWLPVLSELEKSAAALAKNKVKFVISNNYIRYAVLPWQEDVFSQQDWQSLAENNMRERYGNVVDSWKVTVAMQGYGKPLLVSAIDQSLLARIETIAKQFSWQIESIEPALMTVVNHYKNKIKKSSLLMLVEKQGLLLAEIAKGHVVNCSVACPPVEAMAVETKLLLKRTLNCHAVEGTTAIHYFGLTQFLPRQESELTKIKPLDLSSEAMTMSAMLAKL